MKDIFSRNALILGDDYLEKLADKHVAVFGLGGVGGFALESLARAGISEFSIIDFDKISASNINRQLIALNSTIGQEKNTVFTQRLQDINPEVKINSYNSFYTEELNDTIFKNKIDYVIDAIDTAKSKIQLLKYCHRNNLPVITSLGAGNRLDPTQLYICDIAEIKEQNCNFLKNVIRQLNKEGITSGITAVTSTEKPVKIAKTLTSQNILTANNETAQIDKIMVGSLPFTPAVAGYYMGYYVLKELLYK